VRRGFSDNRLSVLSSENVPGTKIPISTCRFLYRLELLEYELEKFASASSTVLYHFDASFTISMLSTIRDRQGQDTSRGIGLQMCVYPDESAEFFVGLE
jgi:hypothetical protein